MTDEQAIAIIAAVLRTGDMLYAQLRSNEISDEWAPDSIEESVTEARNYLNAARASLSDGSLKK